MRLRPRSLLLLVCLLLAGFTILQPVRVACAAKDSKEDPTALRMARLRFQEGVRYFDRGQYAKARAAFLQAYALKKHPSVLLNLAHSELRSGYEADAARHFAQFLRETDGSNPAEIKKAQEGLKNAREQVAEVVLAVDVDDAFVLVDGSLYGRSPLPDPLFLSPGTHVLGVRKGGVSVTRQIAASAGERLTEMVNVTEEAPATGTVPTAAEQDAEPEPVYRGVGREPFLSWLRRKPGGLIGAGVTVLGTATATVFLITSQTNRAAAEDTRQNILETYENDPAVTDEQRQNYGPCALRPTPAYEKACQDYTAYNDTADNHKNIAIVGAGIAVLAAGGTVLGYFLDAPTGTAAARAAGGQRLVLLPIATAGHAGLSVSGRF